MRKLEDIIQHYGVKGMKWGVRRYQPYPKGSKRKGTFLGNAAKSKGRELKTLSKARNKNLNKQSTKDIKAQSRRQALENEYKRLTSSTKLATKADRAQYYKRGSMSDKELKRKVDRLLAKEEYKNLSYQVNKGTLEVGKKALGGLLQVVIPAAAGYALSKKNVRGALKAGLENAKNSKIRSKDIEIWLNTILK